MVSMSILSGVNITGVGLSFSFIHFVQEDMSFMSF